MIVKVHPDGNEDILYENDADVIAFVERMTQRELGIGAQEAWARLDRGEFHGTILQAELEMARWMLVEKPPCESSSESTASTPPSENWPPHWTPR